MKSKYWLIYKNCECRKAKPFATREAMECYVKMNEKYIKVVAYTQTMGTDCTFESKT